MAKGNESKLKSTEKLRFSKLDMIENDWCVWLIADEDEKKFCCHVKGRYTACSTRFCICEAKTVSLRLITCVMRTIFECKKCVCWILCRYFASHARARKTNAKVKWNSFRIRWLYVGIRYAHQLYTNKFISFHSIDVVQQKTETFAHISHFSIANAINSIAVSWLWFMIHLQIRFVTMYLYSNICMLVYMWVCCVVRRWFEN